MKLNIYKRNEVVKTYETQEYRLKFGILEDLAKVINIEEMEEITDGEILRMVAKLLIEVPDMVKDFLFDIFDGLTEEELRNVSVEEIAMVFVDVIIYTITRIERSFGGPVKNLSPVRKS